jgi:hypothetical protein
MLRGSVKAPGKAILLDRRLLWQIHLLQERLVARVAFDVFEAARRVSSKRKPGAAKGACTAVGKQMRSTLFQLVKYGRLGYLSFYRLPSSGLHHQTDAIHYEQA